MGVAALVACENAEATSVAAPSAQREVSSSVQAALPSATGSNSPATAPTTSASPAPRKRSKRCVIPEARPPTQKATGGAAAPSFDWTDANDDCTVPQAFRPWSWSMLRRVRGLREKVVIFTVDGGHSVPTTQLGLDVLRDYEVHATYFLTTSVLSKRGREGRELVQRIATEGHELANHSVNHPSLTKLSDEEVRSEIADADAWITEVLGYSPRPFFRPPFLARDQRTDRITKNLCYRPVWFTVHSRDDEANITAEDITRAVLCDEKGRDRKLENGSILMFHASQEETVKAWPVIITGLRDRGYRFMTLGEAIRGRAPRRERKPHGADE